MDFNTQLRKLCTQHEALITRPNQVDEDWHNGVFKRYQNCVLTAEHAPVYWRYDINPASNPFLIQRLGVNAAMNSGAIYLNDKFYLIARMEGDDRKSFFAIAESDNGIDNFRFWDKPLAIPELPNDGTNLYDMRVVQHEDGWIYGIFCVERRPENAPASDQSIAEAQCGLIRTKDLKTQPSPPCHPGG